MERDELNQLDEIKAKLRSVLRQIEDGEGREVLQLHANVRMELRGPDGELKEERAFHNTVCTAGKNKLLDSTASAKYLKDYAYVCIGTGTNASAAGDTALQTESARALGTLSNPAASTLRVTYTFPAGTGTGAVTESALDYQNGASAAILCRQTFSAVNKGASDTLAVTWDIT